MPPARDDDLRALGVDLLVTAARFVRTAARETTSDLPRALWRALSQIDELGPLRVSDLARVDRCSQPTATSMVQRLADRGWVARTPDPADARAVQVRITPAGRRTLESHRRRVGEALVPRLSELSPEDRRVLVEGLAVLHRLMTDITETAPATPRAEKDTA